MTVKELIIELQKFADDSLNVSINDSEYGHKSIESISLEDDPNFKWYPPEYPKKKQIVLF